MILRNCNFDVLQRLVYEKEVICFGAGKVIDEMYEYCRDRWDILKHCRYICDNDPDKSGINRMIDDFSLPVIDMKQLLMCDKRNLLILITAGAYFEILEQMDSMSWFHDVEVCIFYFIKKYQSDCELMIGKKIPKQVGNREFLIPKVIHYTWFSGEKIPDDMKYYMDTWHKYCPDYEYHLWTADNYDVSKHPYMKNAFEHGKWGFASDYARLDIVYKEGGIYMDMDVEMLRNIDELRKEQAYISFESLTHVNTGSGFGAVKNHPMIKAMRDEYDKIEFHAEPLSENKPCTVWQTKTLRRYGLRCDGSYQVVNGLTIFPFQTLCCKSWNTQEIYRDEDAYTIHHFAGSWLDGIGEAKLREKELFQRSMKNLYT